MNSSNSPTWSRGYRTGLEYTSGLYPFLNPDTLMLPLVLTGVRPPKAVVSAGAEDTRNLTYCELGSGQGVTLNYLAARDPGGTYVGVDYNPGQIKNARNFAEAAGLTNIQFIEESFETLGERDLPDFDVIVLHGIWSWISSSMRAKIVEFIRRKLKPGGIVYNSYNCKVGRSVDTPLRSLFIAAEKNQPGNEVARVGGALNVLKKINDTGARYFSQNIQARKRLEAFPNQNPAYLIHEYLNEDWHSFFFHEVAAEMQDAKLEFVGGVDMGTNVLGFALPMELNETLSVFPDRAELELLKDVWANTQFRRDIYVKGAQKLSPKEQLEILENLRFMLAVPREKCLRKFNCPGGAAELPEVPYEAVLDALDGNALSGREISAIINKHPKVTDLPGLISALLTAGYIELIGDEAAIPRISKSLAGFDRAISELVEAGVNQFFVTRPERALVKTLSALDYFSLQATLSNQKDREQFMLDRLHASGRSLMSNGEAVSGAAESRKILTDHLAEFDKNVLPVFAHPAPDKS